VVQKRRLTNFDKEDNIAPCLENAIVAIKAATPVSEEIKAGAQAFSEKDCQ